MRVPGPKDLHSLFQLFLLYDDSIGLAGLVKTIDFTGFDRRKIYYSVLGRNPENIASCLTPDTYHPPGHFSEAVNSQEFQSSIIKLLLRGFPHHRRIIFIHIPKCAGTDLIHKIRDRHPAINNTLTSQAWTSKPELFKQVRRIVSELASADSVFVYGHMRLTWLASLDLIRPHDDCFTVIRDPLDIALSQVNYILTRICAAAENQESEIAPDLQQWLSTLAIDRPTKTFTREEMLNLAHSILRSKQLNPSNLLCRQLGPGAPTAEPVARAAMLQLILSNIEITDTDHYDAWRADKFGPSPATRMNQSTHMIRRADLSSDDLEYLSTTTREDQKLYAVIMQTLRDSGRLSIKGDDLNKANAIALVDQTLS